MNILVTGASGFVGDPLVKDLAVMGHTVVGVSRSISEISSAHGVKMGVIGHIDGSTDWKPHLNGVDVVIHLANRAHVMDEQEKNPLAVYQSVNTDGTLRLASQAASCGVKRFIFLSSIKVNGESTLPGQPFRSDDPCMSQDPYGLSKYQAELGLRKISLETGLEIVIIRPPLIYGPGVKANFLKMMNWLNKGIPLPFGKIDNLRSLVGLDNLLDLIGTCLTHPKAANQTLLVSDDHDLSTTELLQSISFAMKKPSHLVAIPQSILQMGLFLLGKRQIAERLCSSLQLDIQPTKELLSWKPPFTVEQQLNKTVEAYLVSKKKFKNHLLKC